MSKVNLKQPKGFYCIAGNELWDRLSFYGLLSVLIIFMAEHLGFSGKPLYQLYGIFTTLTFLMPTIGGYLADRFLSHSRSIILGMLLIIAGNLMLLMFTLNTVLLGLAITVCGVGFLKPNNSALIGLLYPINDKRKEGGFTLFYMGMNLGGIIGPIIYGFLSVSFGWRYGFAVGTLGIFGMLMLFIKHYQTFKHNEAARIHEASVSKLNPLVLVLGIIILIGLIDYLLRHLEIFQIMIALLGVAIIAIILKIVFKQEKVDLKKMLFLLILNVFAIFYFACQNQVSGSLMLFVNSYMTQQHPLIKIPSEILVSIEPFFVIITAPLFANIWPILLKKMNMEGLVILRVLASLLMGMLSFICFKLASTIGVTSFSMFSSTIIVGNLFLGIGELFIGPALMSAVTYLINEKYQGTFMGIWSLSIAFSGLIAGFIAQFTAVLHKGQNVYSTYASSFGKVAALMLIVAFIFIFLIPVLRRLVRIN